MVKLIREKDWIKDIILLLLFSIIGIFAFKERLGTEHIFLKLILIIFFVSGIYCGILFICNGRIPFLDNENFDKNDIKNKIIIAVAISFTFMPIMVYGYFFHDDWINFGEGDFFNYSIMQARPVIGLFTELVGKIRVEDSWILCIVAVTGLIIYIELIYELLKRFVPKGKAMTISLLVAFIAPVVNVLSYKAMYIYIHAAVFSILSVILFYKAFNKKLDLKKRFYCLILGAIYICYSNMIYQMTATIALFLIALLFFYGNKKNDIINILFILYYIFSTAVYYVISKILLVTQHTKLLSRSEMISSIEDIKTKVLFFIDVLSENVKQIISSFTYNLFLMESDSIGKLEYWNPIIGKCILFICCIAFIACLVGKFVLYKRWLGLLGIIVIIPLSYYPFLLLKESSYTSYYCISMCSILLIGILEGINVISLNRPILWKSFTILCCIEIICCNVYINKFWVSTNKEPYDYIIHELENKADVLEKTNWIHIYGTVRLGQVDIYAIREVQRAIEEYNLSNNNIKITASDNIAYCNMISYETYETMKDNFTETDMALWQELYIDITNFGYFSLDKNKLNKEKTNQLTKLFNKCEIIPEDGQALCLYLNMTK